MSLRSEEDLEVFEMSSEVKWHVSLPGQKASGPFSAEQIVESVRAGRLSSDALCWCDGMPDWVPLGKVEPFSTAIRGAARPSTPPVPPAQAASPPPTPPQQSLAPSRPAAVPAAPSPIPSGNSGGIVKRLVSYAVALSVLGIACYACYVVVSEKMQFDKGKKLLADGEFSEARRMLQNVADNGYLYGRDANYQAAVASVKAFASDKDEQDQDDLRRPKKAIEEKTADSSCRLDVQADLKDLLGCVPASAPDALPRCLFLADFLAELKLSEGKQIAKDLLGKMKQVGERSAADGGVKSPDSKTIRRIVREDPALAKDILDILATGSESQPYLLQSTLTRLVNEDQALKQPFVAALMNRAEQAMKANRPQEVELLYALAVQYDPKMGKEVEANRLKGIKKQIEDKDFVGAQAALDRLGNRISGSGTESEPASLHLAIAEGLAKSNPGAAARSLDRALAADPSLANAEGASLLWLELHPQPNEERMRRCQDFAGRFPKSPHRPQVLLFVLNDGLQLAKQSNWNRNKAIEYLSAARSAADDLLANSADAKGLDSQSFELMKQLAEVKRKEDALKLAEAILKAVPETSLKSDIERKAMEINTDTTAPIAEGIDPRTPPELKDVAYKIKKELIILDLNQPGAIRQIVSSPKSVHVVRVSQDCRAAKFATDEAEMLRQWVYGGGILWVNNDVLSLFEIQSEHTYGMGGAGTPAVTPQMCPIVEKCGKVTIRVHGGQAINLSHKDVIPLISVDGKTVWSLIPYGKGWISDVKEIDPQEHDSVRYWINFRWFCLGGLAMPKAEPIVQEGHKIGDPPQLPSGLTGHWKSSGGAQFRIEDDGIKLSISLVGSDTLQSMTGDLSRRDGKSDSKALEGRFHVAFKANAGKEHSVRVTGSIVDDGHLRLRCEDWPQFDKRGKMLGKGALSETWSRSEKSPASPRPQ
jgi:hypothetical protein